MSRTSSEGTRGEKDLLKEYINANPGFKINTMNFRPGIKEIEATKARISSIEVLENADLVMEIPLKENMKDYDRIKVENSKVNAKSTKKASTSKKEIDEETK